MLWQIKPGLLSFVLGRSAPIAACTLLFAGSPLMSLPKSPEELWRDPWMWIAAVGVVGPFLFNFIGWFSTRYTWTPAGLSIEQWGLRRTIDRALIRDVEFDRDLGDFLSTPDHGSIVLRVEMNGVGSLPLYDVLTLRGIVGGARIARRLYLEREIAAARFGSTRTKRVG